MLSIREEWGTTTNTNCANVNSPRTLENYLALSSEMEATQTLQISNFTFRCACR